MNIENVNIATIIGGIVSVTMIIIGGYIIANGETIPNELIGIFVSVLFFTLGIQVPNSNGKGNNQ